MEQDRYPSRLSLVVEVLLVLLQLLVKEVLLQLKGKLHLLHLMYLTMVYKQLHFLCRYS